MTLNLDYYQLALDQFDYSRTLRRDFHQHPELGFEEVRTGGIVAQELRKLDLDVTTGVAQTGVVALLEGRQSGPVLMIRVDMDALPVQEQTNLEFASTNSGVMHACGHDGHVAIGLTVAKILADLRNEIQGTVKFVFQPAEEGRGGAECMIAAGVLEEPKVDITLGVHLWNGLAIGEVGISSGGLMAGADIFHVTLTGRGGHGALPHETVDPLIAAAQIVSSLQTIISRNISPLDTAVLSVCTFKAGDAFNVIPQSAEFGGTIRAYLPSVRSKIAERLKQIVNGMAESMGCIACVDIQRLTPAVINDEKITGVIQKSTRENLKSLRIRTDFRTMVSEDMAFMMEQRPGCYLLVGSGNEDPAKTFGHHHPKFDIDENALPVAAALVSSAAMAILADY